MPESSEESRLTVCTDTSSQRSAKSQSANNPFRRTHSSIPQTRTNPPPLPPRKQSHSTLLSPKTPREPLTTTRQNGSLPTSSSTPSDIIRQSLLAAGTAQSGTSYGTRSVHVIKSSTAEQPNPSGTTSESQTSIDQVCAALEQAGMDAESSSFPAIAKRYKHADSSIRIWTCVDALSETSEPARFAMIIVNQPINSREIFARAWHAC